MATCNLSILVREILEVPLSKTLVFEGSARASHLRILVREILEVCHAKTLVFKGPVTIQINAGLGD